MKKLTGFVLLFYVTSGFTQSTPFLNEVVRLQDSTATIFYHGDRYILHYNNGKNWDTLSLADDIEYMEHGHMEAVQIDGTGLKELIIGWEANNSHSYGGPTGGGFENHDVYYGIWSLDTKANLFFAHSESSHRGSDASPFDSITMTFTETERICSYRYEFAVTEKGNIEISNLQRENSILETQYSEETQKSKISVTTDAECYNEPDLVLGVYEFRNGEYRLKKNSGARHLRSVR